jgi:hypothetical protein
MASAPFPSWNRSILTDIYLCHACSYHEIEDGNGAPGGGGLPSYAPVHREPASRLNVNEWVRGEIQRLRDEIAVMQVTRAPPPRPALSSSPISPAPPRPVIGCSTVETTTAAVAVINAPHAQTENATLRAAAAARAEADKRRAESGRGRAAPGPAGQGQAPSAVGRSIEGGGGGGGGGGQPFVALPPSAAPEVGEPPTAAEQKRGAAAVASFLAAVLTEIYLCNVCSCQEILRRNGADRAAAAAAGGGAASTLPAAAGGGGQRGGGGHRHGRGVLRDPAAAGRECSGCG